MLLSYDPIHLTALSCPHASAKLTRDQDSTYQRTTTASNEARRGVERWTGWWLTKDFMEKGKGYKLTYCETGFMRIPPNQRCSKRRIGLSGEKLGL